MYLKDGGHGITEKSLKFWKENKNSIGKITHVWASFEPLLTENRTENFYGQAHVDYVVEYNFVAFGYEGAIFLSGCNSGYFGEGPHGTAKILVELGLNKEIAERVIGHKQIHYNALTCEVK